MSMRIASSMCTSSVCLVKHAYVHVSSSSSKKKKKKKKKKISQWTAVMNGDGERSE